MKICAAYTHFLHYENGYTSSTIFDGPPSPAGEG